MGLVTLPHNLADGTTAYGSQVKSDLDACVAQIANIQDVNVAVGAAIAATKLAAASLPTSVLADDCVTDAKLADHASSDASRAVGTNHIKDAAVTAGKIGANAVVLSKVKLTTVTINLKTATPAIGSTTLPAGGASNFYNIDMTGGGSYASPSTAIIVEVALSSTSPFAAVAAGPPYGLSASLYYDTTAARYYVMVRQDNTELSSLNLAAIATTVNAIVRLIPVS